MQFTLVCVLLIGVNSAWCTGESSDNLPSTRLSFPISSIGKFFGIPNYRNDDSKSTTEKYVVNVLSAGAIVMEEDKNVNNQQKQTTIEANTTANKEETISETRVELKENSVVAATGKAVTKTEIDESKEKNIVIVYCTDPITKTVIAKYERNSALAEYRNVVVEENVADWSTISNSIPAPEKFITKNITMSIRGRIYHCHILTVPPDALMVQEVFESLTNTTAVSNEPITNPINTVATTQMSVNHTESVQTSENPPKTVVSLQDGTLFISTLVQSNQKTPIDENKINDATENGNNLIIATSTLGTIKEDQTVTEIPTSNKNADVNLKPSTSKGGEKLHIFSVLESYESLLSESEQSEEDSSDNNGFNSHLFVSSNNKHPTHIAVHNKFNSDSLKTSKHTEEEEKEVFLSKKLSKNDQELINKFNSKATESAEKDEGVYLSKKTSTKHKNVLVIAGGPQTFNNRFNVDSFHNIESVEKEEGVYLSMKTAKTSTKERANEGIVSDFDFL